LTNNRADKALDEHLTERVLTTESIYRGRIVELQELTVALPNGREGRREVIRHPGAVAVLAELADERILCVRQYRTAPGEVLLEIPAGKLEANEDVAVCARRELAEETGFETAELRKVGEFYTSPGFADERLVLFYATGLTQGSAHPDEDEFVEVTTLSREEVIERLRNGQIRDAKTMIAMQWWLLMKAGSLA
jgi:ADP-ribose pyrophosphatase